MTAERQREQTDLKKFFTIKPTRCINFPNLLRHETLHVSGIIGSLFTVHSALVYVIQVCRHLSSRTRMFGCKATEEKWSRIQIDYECGRL